MLRASRVRAPSHSVSFWLVGFLSSISRIHTNILLKILIKNSSTFIIFFLNFPPPQKSMHFNFLPHYHSVTSPYNIFIFLTLVFRVIHTPTCKGNSLLPVK
uniref:Uncharacterized protein n=1 Tax=Anguilla anguilla TaxID=7936 RepID=A0A0E9WRC7_ANGAN